MKKKLFLSTVLSLSVLLFLTAQANAHTEVFLKDYKGDFVNGTSNPYSPKQSCGLANCHNNYVNANPAYLDNTLYESDWALATKTHANKNGETISYDVPYPQHGISASYHVQMGRNDSWGDVQREYYNGLEEFTSSSGHYGRY